MSLFSAQVIFKKSAFYFSTGFFISERPFLINKAKLSKKQGKVILSEARFIRPLLLHLVRLSP
jgi:hypothetical protein